MYVWPDIYKEFTTLPLIVVFENLNYYIQPEDSSSVGKYCSQNRMDF